MVLRGVVEPGRVPAVLCEVRDLLRAGETSVQLPGQFEGRQLEGDGKWHASVKGENLTILVPQLAHFHFTGATGELSVEFKAPALWAHGWTKLAAWAVDLVARWLTDKGLELADAWDFGWTVTNLEVCADFTGLEFFRGDARYFVGLTSGGNDGRIRVRDKSRTWAAAAETLMFGTRKSRVSFCIYSKLTQLAARRSGDISPYAGVWQRNGWQGDPITRVEFRLKDTALRWTDKESGECFNLRDPAEVTPQIVSMLWAATTRRYRLVFDDGTTRRERMPYAARWRKVQAAAEVERELHWTQDRSMVAEGHTARMVRAAQDAAGALARLLALAGAEPGPETDVLESYRRALEFVVGGPARGLADMEKAAESGDRYYRQRWAFFGEEMARAAADLATPPLRARAPPPAKPKPKFRPP